LDIDDTRVPPRHYAFLCFLTLLNVMNFVDRQLLASFANFIVPDLGLTNTQFGLLTGLFFIVFYSAMGVFMGALADMVNRPRLVAAGLAAWSALTALSGAARGFWTLAVPRMLIGVGESIMTPTSMSMLADRFPPARLGFASGFYYMGVPIGVGASLLIVGYLGPAIGWRNCFYLLGAIGVGLAVIMLVFVKETPRRHHAAPTSDSSGAEQPAAAPAPSFRIILKTLGFALRNCPALAYTIAGGVALHFILGAAAYYRTEAPLAAAVQFTTLPPTELRTSGYYDLMREVHADAGVVYLANTSGGNKFRMYLKEDLEAPDFSGLRLRASPVYVPLIEALGGTPVLMSPGDVYTALERGLIDGYGWTYTGLGVFGWNEVSGYVIDHPFYSLDGAILINQEVWDGLGDAARACLEEVGVALEGRVEAFIGSRLEAEDEALKEMGMEFITFSPEDAAAYVDAAMTAGWQDFLDSNAAAFEGRPDLADALMDAGN